MKTIFFPKASLPKMLAYNALRVVSYHTNLSNSKRPTKAQNLLALGTLALGAVIMGSILALATYADYAVGHFCNM